VRWHECFDPETIQDKYFRAAVIQLRSRKLVKELKSNGRNAKHNCRSTSTP
jgi:hypothetical protein